MQLNLNASFISNIHDVYGLEGDSWLKELPQLIEELSNNWDCQFLHPLSNLSYSFVGLVKMRANSKSAIIKIVPANGNIISEMKWLSCMEKGVPQIYFSDEKRNAFLMEYLEPGYSLKKLVTAGDDDAATKIICQTIRNLQSQHRTDFNFQHLSELPKALTILENRFDARLLSQAKAWFHDLTMDRSNDVILHGDLHHDNILSSGNEWKAIDPHGYLGDPAAEVGAMMKNPIDCFPMNRSLSEIIERRLNIMAHELPFDAKRIKAWAFCMTVLSAAWSLEGHGAVTELEMNVASAIDKAKI